MGRIRVPVSTEHASATPCLNQFWYLYVMGRTINFGCHLPRPGVARRKHILLTGSARESVADIELSCSNDTACVYLVSVGIRLCVAGKPTVVTEVFLACLTLFV